MVMSSLVEEAMEAADETEVVLGIYTHSEKTKRKKNSYVVKKSNKHTHKVNTTTSDSESSFVEGERGNNTQFY